MTVLIKLYASRQMVVATKLLAATEIDLPFGIDAPNKIDATLPSQSNFHERTKIAVGEQHVASVEAGRTSENGKLAYWAN